MKAKTRVSLWILLRVSIFCLLLIAPSVGRALLYYRGAYATQDVPRPDSARVELPERTAAPFLDVGEREGTGRVVIDRAHENLVADTELNLLLSRVTRRGMETVSLTGDDELSETLRTAVALVVVAPHQAYSEAEIAVVERFVSEGGRLFLAADPSRYQYRTIEDEIYGEVYVIESDVSAINSLASAFGLAFADDYLYNVQENEGNYQYVIVREFSDHPLTAGVSEIVLYAAHSLIASEEVIAQVQPETLSSLSELGGGLSVIGLGGGGNVAAIGDFTLLTEPYSGARDNNRLVANIASYLSGATRTFGLSEFPLCMGDEIGLVSVAAPPLDGALQAAAISQASRVQAAVTASGRTLRWRTAPDAGHDTLYLGLYDGLAFWPEVADILAQDGITFTLETAARTREALSAEATREAPPTPSASDTPTPIPEAPHDWVHVPGFGRVDAKQMALYYLNERDGRQVLFVLAFDGLGLGAATDRLLTGDLAGCLIEEDREGDPDVPSIALCPVEYAPVEPEPTPGVEGTPGVVETLEPVPGAETSVLIVADDDDEGIYEWWSSAYQFYDIVTTAGYSTEVWSTGNDGPLAADQLEPHGVVLWCAGDYQAEGGTPSPEELDLLEDYLDAGGSVLLIGAFLGDPGEGERGLLLDVQVAAGGHPLAAGFEEGQVIVLERFSAEEDYAAVVLADVDDDAVIWRRGPESELAGAPVLAAVERDGARLVQMGIPLYLLPYDDGTALGTAILTWLVGEE